jgi:small-conductance mechanosensitive channel
MDMGGIVPAIGGGAAASAAVSFLFNYWARRTEGDAEEAKEAAAAAHRAAEAAEEKIEIIARDLERVKEEVRRNEKDMTEIKAWLASLQSTVTTALVALGRIEGELKARRESGQKTP